MLPSGNPILEGVALGLRTGEVVSLLGPSGSGKSTLLKALFSPDELTSKGYAVRWGRRAVHAEPAYVPQRGALLDHLDVRGNIELAQAGGGQPKAAAAWLQAVDLDPDLGAPGRSTAALSGGQAQRVAVARVLAAARKIVVLDEPSVGLDPEASPHLTSKKWLKNACSRTMMS